MATIETRQNNDGTTTYRVKVRFKGFPTQSATFARNKKVRVRVLIHGERPSGFLKN